MSWDYDVDYYNSISITRKPNGVQVYLEGIDKYAKYYEKKYFVRLDGEDDDSWREFIELEEAKNWRNDDCALLKELMCHEAWEFIESENSDTTIDGTSYNYDEIGTLMEERE